MYKKNHELVTQYKNYKKVLTKILKDTEKKYYEKQLKCKNIKNPWKMLITIYWKNQQNITLDNKKMI